MLIVGIDIIVNIVEWVMVEFMKNFILMKRVKDELDEVVGFN